MCPTCITTIAWIAAGAASTGGLGVLALQRLRAGTGASNVEPKPKPTES